MTDSLIGKRVRVTETYDDIRGFDGMCGVVIDDDGPDISGDPDLRLLYVRLDDGQEQYFYESEIAFEEERHE